MLSFYYLLPSLLCCADSFINLKKNHNPSKIKVKSIRNENTINITESGNEKLYLNEDFIYSKTGVPPWVYIQQFN